MEIIFKLIAVNYFALLFMFTLKWWNIKEFKPKTFLAKTKISIIVAAKNESASVLNCLRSIAGQDYPENLFEVIVVDDHSSDNSYALVEEYKRSNASVKLICLEQNSAGKKAAITAGIKMAAGVLMVTSDADCVAGNKWLSCLAAFYEAHRPKMIVAPVVFKEGRTWLEKIQEIEFAGLMAVTGASVAMNNPLMCNGANLAYEKQAFIDLDGYNNANDMQTGDDVMLMMMMQKRYPGQINFLRAKEAEVYTSSNTRLSDLIQQRMRWSSKAFVLSSWWSRYVAVSVYVANLTLLMALCFNLFTAYSLLLLTIWLVKSVADILLLGSAGRYFEKEVNPLWIILIQPLYAIYVVIAGFSAISKKYKWK